ncbi:hypothetical protein M569_00018 [Genlisea aurea]|uniref:Uncharacterized protein n=1 Tax=Genlisea aurea TaxID=192259 RepID=S8EFB6_9LAMI|nr:hypothetical protein M569_00018 [Genlisea aurea]
MDGIKIRARTPFYTRSTKEEYEEENENILIGIFKQDRIVAIVVIEMLQAKGKARKKVTENPELLLLGQSKSRGEEGTFNNLQYTDSIDLGPLPLSERLKNERRLKQLKSSAGLFN